MDGVEENNEDEQGVACLRALSNLKKQLSSPPDPKPKSPTQTEFNFKVPVRLQIMVVSQATSSISFAMEETLPERAEIDICRFTEGDIASFIKTKGDELLKKKPQLKDGKDKIIQSLTNGAQGMFQWVNGAIDLLEKFAGDVKDIDKWLGNLPTNLSQTYEKIFMRLPAGNEAEDAQRRIRLALNLLAVYARPLSATELYYACTIGTIGTEEDIDGTPKTIDSEVKRLLRGREPFKHNKFAIEEIRRLLDSLVEFDVQRGTVQLAHPSIRKALLLPDKPKDRQPQNAANEQLRLAGYQFTEREAHSTVAGLCMRICQSSTLSHATAFATSQIPFVEYSWDQWKYHLRRSSAKPGIILDEMIKGVSRDTIAFLGALTEFAARDFVPVAGRYSDLEYILSLKRARECLLPAIEPLTVIQREPEDELSKSLVSHQKLVAAIKESTMTQTKYEKCEEFARKGYKKIRNRLMPKDTTVIRLRVDALLEKPSFKKLPPMSEAASSLLEAARNLRTVALRFAVNPVYTALISRAGGTTFSPIHPLVYVASLLEECGSYPYWDRLLSNWDPVDPFICNEDDPQAGPARFVLQCFAWRELQQDQVPANAQSNRQYMRAASRVNAQPNPDGRQLLRVSTANREQVKRLHGMTGSQYLTSYTLLHLFGGDNSSNPMVRILFYNPIGQHHIRSNLLLNEDGSYISHMFEDPKTTLARHAPESLMEAPVTEALDAIPDILRLCFVKYVTVLFEVFGNVASRVIAVHVQQMMGVSQGLGLTWRYLNLLWETDNWVSWCHLIPALFLFWLRNKYFPSVGAHYLDNPWARLRVAWTEPTMYLQAQHDFGWWYWARSVSTTVIFSFLISFLLVVRTGVTVFFRGLRKSHPAYSAHIHLSEHALTTFTTFMHMCSLHRHMISVLYLLGTIVASGYVMMRDPSRIFSIFIFTIWYWFYSFLGIFNNLLLAGCIAAFGGWGFLMWLVSFVPQYYALKVVGRNQLAIARVLSWPFKPFVWAAKFAWTSLLYAYVHVLRIFGILVLCGFVFLAFHWFQRVTLDPYDLEGTVRKLQKAANLARITLKEAELRYIGEYPLGGEIEASSEEQPASEESNGAPPQPEPAPEPAPQPTPQNAPPNTTPDPELAAGQMNGHAGPGASTPVPPPPKAQSQSPGNPARGASSGANTTPASSQDMDDFVSVFNQPDVRRRLNRGLHVNSTANRTAETA